MKVVLTTVAVWLACVAGLRYWYVVAGSQGPPVAAEYVRWKDYRLAFFVLTMLPASLLVLIPVLWIEWRLLSRKRRQPR